MVKQDKQASIDALIKAVEERDLLLRKSKMLSKGSPNFAAINALKIRAPDSRRKSSN
jgi:hypothetical protein